MKKIRFITLLMFAAFQMNAQTIQTESLIKGDSILTLHFRVNVEGCIKVRPRYVNEYRQSCPVFLDEKGFLFYICLFNNHLEYVTLDENVEIDE